MLRTIRCFRRPSKLLLDSASYSAWPCASHSWCAFQRAEGEKFKDDLELQEGWAHGSTPVQGGVETHRLDHRDRNDNAVRHAGFFALHDWLFGSDAQWMRSGKEADRYYSHDHGQYLGGGNWQSLAQSVNQANPLPAAHGGPTGLDPSEIERLATRLERLTREEIEAAVGGRETFPQHWPVTEQELAAVVSFAYERRTEAAARLRALVV
jgi:hypothetical protein